MKIDDILEEAFIVGPDEAISHVAARMADEKRHEAFVFDGSFKGVVAIDDIVRRNTSEPQKMKVSYFTKPVSVFSTETPVEDIINYMLVNEYRSLPVEKNGKIYAITKPRLLGFVKDEVFEGKTAKDIMQPSQSVSEDTALLTVLSIMRNSGASMVPVVDNRGKFSGLIDSLSLSGIVMGRERSSMGERDGEKGRIGSVDISRFVTKEVMVVGPDESVKKIVRGMSSEEIYNAVVEDDNKFMGLITLRDLFKLICKSVETVYIRVSGLTEEDEFVRGKIDELIERSVQKVLKIVKVSYVVIHVEIHKRKEKSDRRKYSVQGRFVTDKGNFYASDHEWEPTKAMKLFLEKIESEVYKQVEKNRGY